MHTFTDLKKTKKTSFTPGLLEGTNIVIAPDLTPEEYKKDVTT